MTTREIMRHLQRYAEKYPDTLDQPLLVQLFRTGRKLNIYADGPTHIGWLSTNHGPRFSLGFDESHCTRAHFFGSTASKPLA
jgi:hypothetical protein